MSSAWQMVQLDSGGGDGLFITIRYHGKRFYVSLLPPPSASDTIEGPLITRYDSIDDGNFEEFLAIQNEIIAVIREAGCPVWTQLAPPLPESPDPGDLHSLLHPDTFYLQFITENGNAELIRQTREEALYRHTTASTIKIVNDMGVPQYSSKDIGVLQPLVGNGYISRVIVDGKEIMCCKCVGDSFHGGGIEREFDCLRKIARSNLAGSIRVPRLLGLVTSAETGLIIGILEEYIPGLMLAALWEKELKDGDKQTLMERGKKWGAQIRETVDLLHEIGVIWGDGKAHNVLIRTDTDDAWLIDFGGSYTNGWVDEELMETEQGDKQAVSRIVEFLNS